MITTTPLIQAGVFAEFLAALMMITVAILVEHGWTTKTSLAVNMLGLTFMLISTGIDIFVLPLLMVYLLIGVYAYMKKKRGAFFLFSSKSYGSLMLAIAFLHVPQAQSYLLTLQVLNVWWINTTLASVALVAACWVIIIPVVYLLCFIVDKKTRRHH
jgi:hypothetical protein